MKNDLGIPQGLWNHLETQRKISEIDHAPVVIGSIVYAILEDRFECIACYEIVRILRVDGDSLTVERAQPRENDGWRRGTWTIHKEKIYRG